MKTHPRAVRGGTPHTSFPHFYVPPPLQVSVHVTREPSGALDFVHKNFTFRNMSLMDLMAAVSGEGGGAAAERYFQRSVGVNPRKEPSQLPDSFPFLASDVHLPLHLLPPPPPPSSTSLLGAALAPGGPRKPLCGGLQLTHHRPSQSRPRNVPEVWRGEGVVGRVHVGG